MFEVVLERSSTHFISSFEKEEAVAKSWPKAIIFGFTSPDDNEMNVIILLFITVLDSPGQQSDAPSIVPRSRYISFYLLSRLNLVQPNSEIALTFLLLPVKLST